MNFELNLTYFQLKNLNLSTKELELVFVTFWTDAKVQMTWLLNIVTALVVMNKTTEQIIYTTIWDCSDGTAGTGEDSF